MHGSQRSRKPTAGERSRVARLNMRSETKSSVVRNTNPITWHGFISHRTPPLRQAVTPSNIPKAGARFRTTSAPIQPRPRRGADTLSRRTCGAAAPLFAPDPHQTGSTTQRTRAKFAVPCACWLPCRGARRQQTAQAVLIGRRASGGWIGSRRRTGGERRVIVSVQTDSHVRAARARASVSR